MQLVILRVIVQQRLIQLRMQRVKVQLLHGLLHGLPHIQLLGQRVIRLQPCIIRLDQLRPLIQPHGEHLRVQVKVLVEILRPLIQQRGQLHM